MFNLAVGSSEAAERPAGQVPVSPNVPQPAGLGGARVFFAKIDIVNAIGQTSAQEGLGTPYLVLR